jgi:cytochrome P450
MNMFALTTVLLIGVLAWILKVLYDEFTSPLRQIPGPPLARFTRLWYLWTIWKGDAHHVNIELHKRYAPPGESYAPIVRLGPNLYSLSSPDKTVYGIGSKMPKSAWYEGWKHPSPERFTMFTDRDIPRHNQTRKKFQSMYSLSSLLHYEGQVDAVQDVFREKLRDIANSKTAVDMHHWLQCYAFDVIGSITFGRRFGFLDKGEDVQDCMRSLDSSMVYSTLVGVYHWIHPFLYQLLERIPTSGAAGRSYLMSFVQRRISEREAQVDSEKAKAAEISRDGPKDFLDVVLDAERNGEKGIDKSNVFLMAITNVIAGSDTTAVSLSSIIWHLAKNPNALRHLRQEINECIEKGVATADHIPFKEGQKLPYLQACIKEGLRLCSATGLPLWRVVPPGGAEILGQFFPQGSEVGVNSWVAHYDESIWGADAAEFRPERWLATQNDSARLKMLEEHFMPVRSATVQGKGR